MPSATSRLPPAYRLPPGHRRWCLVTLALFGAFWLLLAISPNDRADWALENVLVVLFVPAALPWYYTWPLAIVSALAQSRPAIAAIAGFSTWIMVIFKPDGSHGMYSWLHVILATGCAVAAWYSLAHAPEPAAPEPAPEASTP